MIERVRLAFEDDRSRARALRWMWIVSTAFTLLGFAVMFYLLFLRS